METWLLSGVIILIASLLQTSTGFGFSVIATPFLLIIYNPYDAIQINLILSLVISIYMMKKISAEIDRRLMLNLIKGSALGAPLGIIVYLFADVRLLKIAVSLVILFLAALMLFKFKIKRKEKNDLLVGGFSGLLTTGMGIPGPPLLIYFTGLEAKKEALRSTSLAYFCFIYGLSLILQVLLGGTNTTVWVSALSSIPLVFLGMYLGQLLFKRMSQQAFKIILYLLITVSGSYLLISSL